MPSVTLTFSYPLNASLQVGDIAYYTPTSTVGNTSTSTSPNNVIAMGAVTSIDQANNSYVVDFTALAALPTSSDFIFFSKNNIANMTSVAGYYMEVKMVNNSTSHAELFSVNTDLSQSSK